MLVSSLTVDAGEFASRTGWTIKPEGACKGDMCVPLPAGADAGGGQVAVDVVAERLGMPVVHDEGAGLWAIGPEGGSRALSTAVLPDITLPDLDGNPFSLASLRGQKVLLVAWASW